MKNIVIVLFLMVLNVVNGQTLTKRIERAMNTFSADSQVKNALVSLYIIDGNSGKVVYEKNSLMGMAPASTEKTITSSTSFDLLGHDYSYKTFFYYIPKGNNKSSVIIKGSCDPSFGSWRWKQTLESETINRIIDDLLKAGIKNIDTLYFDKSGWDDETIPGGWTWRDIGNYYGAGASSLNWRENQFDLVLKSGKNVNDSVTIIDYKPHLYNYSVVSYVLSSKDSNDNTYIYLPVTSNTGVIRGTIPVNKSRYAVSGSIPSSETQFAYTLADSLQKKGVSVQNINTNASIPADENKGWFLFHTEQSPPLDSLNYWFLKKSINLYGEAFLKTMAHEKTGQGSTEKGIELIKNYWQDKGISAGELNILDGSGLSPENRVTTHAEVTVLKYASKQPWFNSFYYSLPEYNHMKMKSGTISHVKGFAGYQTSKEGQQYIFSFLINNYNGSESTLVKKMYAVLNELK